MYNIKHLQERVVIRQSVSGPRSWAVEDPRNNYTLGTRVKRSRKGKAALLKCDTGKCIKSN